MNPSKKIGLFVIGDIGRSPRMVNHAIELANLPKTTVEIVGLLETELPSALRRKSVSVVRLPVFYLKIIKALPSFVYLFLRILIEFWIILLFLLLRRFKKYDLIFVQNPPAIPLLPALFVYKLLCRCQVQVDVHNFGFTLFQTKSRFLRAIMQFLEIVFIKITADKIYTVSRDMKEKLARDWRVGQATVLYDQPNPKSFRKLDLGQKHEFLKSLPEFSVSSEETILTAQNKENGRIERKEGVLVFAVSSSWSSDDNFPVLLAALELYKREAAGLKKTLAFVFTGTGPVKEKFAPLLLAIQNERIRVYIKWLKTEEYPQMIACADFGISLHDSTSGFDLPIKILDYFGCGVPAIAYNYSKTIEELVVPGENGFLFSSAEELCGLFKSLVLGKNQISWNFPQKNWSSEWSEKVKMNI